LNLDDNLMRQARKRAARDGRTLTSVIEEALRLLLLTHPKQHSEYQLRWITRRGDRAPAADVADRDALYDRMEGRG
jgi:hypothetical protein